MSSAQHAGNPIALATGDKTQTVRDFRIGSGSMALSMVRRYHSMSNYDGRMGYGWTWSYGWSLKQPSSDQVTIRRADGKQMSFNGDGSGTFRRQHELLDETVVKTASGWRYKSHNGSYADFDSAGRLMSLDAEDGRAVTVAYDASGNPTSLTGPYGRKLAVTVDGKGRIATVSDSLGRSWQYSYDGNDNLMGVTYPDGTTRGYLYENATHTHDLTGIVDAMGRRYAIFSYDDKNRAVLSEHPLTGMKYSVAYNSDNTISVTEPDGAVRTYTKKTIDGVPVIDAVSDAACSCGAANNFTLDDKTGLMTASRNRAGVESSYSYDANGRLLSETEAVGTSLQRTTSYTYDAAGHIASVTDAAGNVTSYAYDSVGHRISKTDALGNVTRWSWNSDGTLAAMTAPDGGVIHYGYDGSGDLVSVTTPDGAVRRLDYDAVGRIVAASDALGATTHYDYDVRDHVMAIGLADGGSIRNSFNAAGDLVSRTDAAGLVTRYSYDADHHPLTVERPDGTQVVITYNGKGKPVRKQLLDAQGAVAAEVSMSYDADSRLLSVTYGDGSSVTDSYDDTGHLLTVTDEAGRVTTNAYDVLGRLTSTTNPANETVSYGYDLLGRKTLITAANGVATGFGYDALGRVTQETSPDRGNSVYGYGPTGDLLTRTDGNGITSNYSFDAMHRLAAIDYPSDPSRDVSLAYDADGRLTKMTDASGVTTYGYDIMGRTTDVSWTPKGARRPVRLAYGYDAAGRLASMTYPSGRVVTYNYGPDGRISGIDATVDGSARTLLSDVRYQALGGVASRTLGNGIVETRNYDSRGRLTAIDAGDVLHRTLSWLPQSVISSIDDGVNAAASQSFGYDAADRLTSASGLYGNLTYGYDANGNRLSRGDSRSMASYSYQPGTNRLTAAGNVTYDRDAAGNRLSDGRLRYAYGADNRLASVSRIRRHVREKRLASYVYNGRGERVMKRLGREDEQATWYVYDLSGHLVAELAAHHRNARVTAEYVYGPTGRLATIAVRGDDGRGREERGHHRGRERDDAPESVYWHINDHLGTPQALTNRRGRVVWAANYLPFGELFKPRHGDDDDRGREHREHREGRHWKVTNNFRFPGQYFDAETGLNYNYYRDYDPSLGRYIEHDPIGLNGGMNPFGYVSGNPLINVDPMGLTMMVTIGVGGAFQQTAAGASQSYSLGASTSGKFCFITTTCARVGPGESAGAGIVVSASKGDFCPGNTATLGTFAEGGDALLAGGSVDAGSSGDVSGSVGFKGFVGGGAAAGTQLCVSHTSCW